MEEASNSKFYKQKHVINIALASQMRMHDLLNRIAMLDAGYAIDSPEKQKLYLNLVRQFIISATPYISQEDAKKYREEILNMNVKKISNVKKGVQNFNYKFDYELDKRLNEILMELQNLLRPVFTKIQDDYDEGDPYN